MIPPRIIESKLCFVTHSGVIREFQFSTDSIIIFDAESAAFVATSAAVASANVSKLRQATMLVKHGNNGSDSTILKIQRNFVANIGSAHSSSDPIGEANATPQQPRRYSASRSPF